MYFWVSLRVFLGKVACICYIILLLLYLYIDPG